MKAELIILMRKLFLLHILLTLFFVLVLFQNRQEYKLQNVVSPLIKENPTPTKIIFPKLTLDRIFDRKYTF